MFKQSVDFYSEMYFNEYLDGEDKVVLSIRDRYQSTVTCIPAKNIYTPDLMNQGDNVWKRLAKLFPNLKEIRICVSCSPTFYESFIVESKDSLEVINWEFCQHDNEPKSAVDDFGDDQEEEAGEKEDNEGENQEDATDEPTSPCDLIGFSLPSKPLLPKLRVLKGNLCHLETVHHILETCGTRLEILSLNRPLAPYDKHRVREESNEYHDDIFTDEGTMENYDENRCATDKEIQLDKSVKFNLENLERLDLRINNRYQLVRMIPVFETMKNLKEMNLRNVEANIPSRFWIRIFKAITKVQTLRVETFLFAPSAVDAMRDYLTDLEEDEISEWD